MSTHVYGIMSEPQKCYQHRCGSNQSDFTGVVMDDRHSTLVKRCTRCKEEKVIADFHFMASSKDGHAWNCKACASKTSATWREDNKDYLKISKAAYHAANREQIAVKHAAWVAANIDHVKKVGAAYRAANRETAKANSVAWRAANTARSRSTVAAWRAANPGKARAIVAAWLKENPNAKREHSQNREARKRNGGKLSKGITEKLFQMQRGKCACCGKPLGDGYHLDHRMPLALGGLNVDANMQLLSAKCNLQKGAKHPVDFMQSRGFLL